MKKVTPSRLTLLHDTKLKHVKVALAVHQRATRQIRQKLA
jgi:hypothetical protein